LKRLLLLFWAVWLSVVLLSNLADAGKGLGILGDSWPFASGNLKAISDTTAKYGIPDLVNGMLFAGVILLGRGSSFAVLASRLDFSRQGSRSHGRVPGVHGVSAPVECLSDRR